ncbi:MAG: hypothetical protein C0507_15445 [Cyanobacteria bacterium PR.3.49]|nr:hypothetical protein [Cyanobacteria bacterium PR.3.49]
MSRAAEFFSGATEAIQDHVSGLRQIAGEAPAPAGEHSRSTAESLGFAAAESALFLASGLLARKVPVVGKLCGGKISGIIAGGVMGLTQSVEATAPESQRAVNTIVAAGTMGILEIGPAVAAKIPGVFSSQNTLSGSIARSVATNGVAGLFGTEMQSFAKTGHAASLSEALTASGTWMLTGGALNAIGFKLGNYMQKLEAAQRWQKNLPWKYKQVIELNARDLQPGQQLSPGNYRIGYESQGIQRTFGIYISDGAASLKKAPLTVFLHGLSKNGESSSIVRELEFNRLADESAAIIAYPHALPVRTGLLRGMFQAWNDNNFGFLRNDQSYSDVRAFKDMVNVITRYVPVADTGNMAIGGFSLGGKLAHRLAASLDNVSALSTIHSTIDTFDKNAIKFASQRHPIDVQIIHGLKDNVLPFEGGKSLFSVFLQNSSLSRPNQQAKFWAASNRQLAFDAGMSSENVSRNFSVTRANRDFRLRRFISANGYEVTELVTADGAHRIHGAEALYDLTQVLTGYPLPASRFDARKEVWQFLMDSIRRNALRKQNGAKAL